MESAFVFVSLGDESFDRIHLLQGYLEVGLEKYRVLSLVRVNTFVLGGIGYYPHARVFTAVYTSANTRGICFQNFLSNPT